MKGQNRIKRGSVFRGVLSYVLDHDEPEYIGGTLPVGSLNQMTREFVVLANTRNDIEKPVWHNSLRLPAGEHISNKKWNQIATDYMSQLGFDDSAQWIAFKHNKSDGEHIHIIANRVLPTGFVYLGQNENLKSTKIISELEHKYCLTVTKTANIDDDNKIIIREKSAMKKQELDKMKRTGHISERVRLQEHLDEAIKNNPTVAEFVNKLNSAGASATPNVASTGRMNGFSFSLKNGELAFSGSKLGRKYTWSSLLNAGLQYDAERDAAFLASLKHKKSSSREIEEDFITARLSSKVVMTTDAEKLRLMSQIERNYQQEGNQFFCIKTGQLSFTEEADRILCHITTPEAIAAQTKLAKVKFGNEFKSFGSEKFRRESWIQAALHGCLDQGYEANDDDILELKRRLSELESKPDLHNKIAVLLNDEDGSSSSSLHDHDLQRQLDDSQLAVAEKEQALQTLFSERKQLAQQRFVLSEDDRNYIKKQAYETAVPSELRQRLSIARKKVREIKSKIKRSNKLLIKFKLNKQLNVAQADLSASKQATNTPILMEKQKTEVERLSQQAEQHYQNLRTRKYLELVRVDEQIDTLTHELNTVEQDNAVLVAKMNSDNQSDKLQNQKFRMMPNN
jgi:relaxase-like protein/conjugative element/phage-associated large polyvalent protein